MPFLLIALLTLSACTPRQSVGDWWYSHGEVYDVGDVKTIGIPKEGK